MIRRGTPQIQGNELMKRLIECVPNFSEGRDAAKVDAIVSAMSAVPGVYVLDRRWMRTITAAW